MSDCTTIDCLHVIPKVEKISFTRGLVASSIGSLVATVVLNPITVLKINLQQPNCIAKISISRTIKNIYTNHGIKGFWAGSQMGVLQSLPSTIIYMSLYEHIKHIITNNNSSSWTKFAPGISGGLARIVSVSIIAPLELIRTKQAVSNKSAIDIYNNIIKVNGINGFYIGWGSTISRDVPYSAMYWLFFEMFRSYYNSLFDTSEMIRISWKHNLINFMSGASASCIAAITTHPFDVLKTQRQLSTKDQRNVTILELYKSGKIFLGLSMRLATVIPASAIMVTIYEYIKLI